MALTIKSTEFLDGSLIFSTISTKTVISLKMSGKITYNGHGFKEFVPQRTAGYISQQDWHAAEMTVRETLDFSARCQGVGTKYGKIQITLLNEIHVMLSFKTSKQICFWSLVEEKKLLD